MFKIDTNTPFGARVAKRLQEEQVVWLTTVRPDGVPQPNPVWFLWDGETILIYSQPEAKKVSHIRANPHVALNLNCTEDGGDVVVITGRAEIEAEPTITHLSQRYVEKYRQGFKDINETPESMAKSYSTVIRVRPTHLRGF